MLLIDGQDVGTPLNLDSITKDQFKGCCPSIAGWCSRRLRTWSRSTARTWASPNTTTCRSARRRSWESACITAASFAWKV